MNEKVKRTVAEAAEAMQGAWNGVLKALAEAEEEGAADALVYLNGVGFRPTDTPSGKVLAAGLLANGWNRSTDGWVIQMAAVKPGPSNGMAEVFNPELKEFRRVTLSDLFERHLAVKLAAGEHGQRLRVHVIGGIAPWTVAGAFPDGDAVAKAYFDTETLATREAVAEESKDLPLLEIEE